jgi:hypothetical protein
MNKYYTPTIDEFHIGFEYEYMQFSEELECVDRWLPVNITIKALIPEINKFEDINKIRVKYLNREDIRSFGFVDDLRNSFIHDKYLLLPGYYTRAKTEIQYDFDTKICTIGSTGQIVFIGKIKNKSELKRILKQIGVIDE